MNRHLSALARVCRTFRRPKVAARGLLYTWPEFCRGAAFADNWNESTTSQGGRQAEACDRNPLWDYFFSHSDGPGIWKWIHYFEIYHRHFARFRQRPVNVLEIGIYSGGSLGMWQSYFGSQCHVFGVDIEEACRAYETDSVSVFIGDQEDRSFWADFKKNAAEIHVLIDDGGHRPEQQIVTLEEMLPYMPAGSVYLCEDVHGISNRFAAYAAGLVARLNAMDAQEGTLASKTSSFQQAIHSVHFYPYACVIEKHECPCSELVARKHGTEWQPFFENVSPDEAMRSR